VEIILPDGSHIQYKIGDKKYTDICDYMNNCEYTCSPKGPEKLLNTEIIQETYNNQSLNTNNDRITERIRALYKDQTFYLRDQLIAAINIDRPYPLEQIYHVLTKMVKNKNEILVDRYGRSGHLIDRRDTEDNSKIYYVFQPLEITDENASLYERRVPVPHKNRRLDLEIPKEFPKKVAAKEAIEEAKQKRAISEEPGDEYIREQYELILQQFREHLEYIYTKKSVPTAEKDWDWYMHARKVFPHISTVYELDQETMMQYFVYHILDMLLFKEKIVIIQTLYSGYWEPTEKNRQIEMLIKDYFDKRIMTESKKRGIFLNKDNSWKIYIQDSISPTEWKEAEPQEVNQFKTSITKMVVPISKLSDNVGFMSLFKNQQMVFYVKDMHNARNSGARCDSAGKTRIIELL
jgi:hypothetical protein